ncbi:F-type ATPase subunit b [Limihaloglobus sulfuriphilus]|uniref:ATP synthase subunit b n=1 Tax=Limihaloglobus sulfuriphilus TaxID=1851148 RepID=A0A1Q2MHP5_9BACT|nr:F0F1 ATP synthase subunit B [Limihaloglobus sulfuriphilus]AQQ72169.1 F-type ATPase subunit b [Limihaloglobus sulfuriphilus]
MSRFKRLTISAILIACTAIAAAAEPAAHEAGEAGGKVNLFSGTIAESIWTLVSFGILVFVLYKLAWGPLLGSLKKREEKIACDISSAEHTRAEAQKVLEEYRQKLAAADEESRQAAAKALAQAQEKASAMVETAREQSFELKKQARQDIIKATDSARSELAREAGSMVLELGSSILGKSISQHDNQKLIDEAVDIYARKKQNKAAV